MALFDKAFLADPYPEYARLRAEAPVTEIRSLSGRIWLVTRYEDVRSVLLSEAFSEYDLPAIIECKQLAPDRGGRSFAKVGKRLRNWLFFMGGPSHFALRRALTPVYSVRAVDRARDAVRAFIAARLGARRSCGTLEGVDDLAWPLPAVATSALLGLPLDTAAETADLASKVLKVFEPLQRMSIYEEIDDGFTALDRLLTALPEATDGLEQLEARISAKLDGVSGDDLRAIAVMLFAAGQDTIAAAIGNAMHHLALDPALLARLRAKPELIPAATRELVRFEPPVQIVARVSQLDQTVGSVRIAKGDRVCLALASANRDAGVFPSPDLLDPERNTAPSLAFGCGHHFCIGAHLTGVVLEELLRQLVLLPHLSLVGCARRPSYVFRGFSSLRLDIGVKA